MVSSQPTLPVLIVEDEFAIREALTEFLEEEGFVVAGAAHGQEALEYLDTMPLPALILLDLRMPRMNGAQFLEVRQSNPRLAAIPTILMSADSSGQYEVPAGSVVGHLNKPVHLNDVLRLVERYCSLPQKRTITR